MPFDPQSFRSALQYDGARPNLFQAEMTWPTFMAGDLAGESEKFTYMCRAASIPEQTVAEIPVAYQGRQIKVAGNRTFANWIVTIINDEDFSLRDKFERWNNYLNDHLTNERDYFAVNSNEYGADARIVHLGKDGYPIRSYRFIGLWPTLVSDIALAWDSNDTLETFDVTFAYQWWEPEENLPPPSHARA